MRWCCDHDVPISAVNRNPWNPYSDLYGTCGKERKLFADVYIDDKALNTADIEKKGFRC
ncbi:MAG: hypothetical protein FWH07_04470 [Oscillospiraceae bacterium]|nr:hypothetical protein [Oscillospiraceae bacterium]